MNPFWISEIAERNGEKTLYINPLPDKYCTFDCVFCPIEARTIKKTEDSFAFEGTADFFKKLEDVLKTSHVDKVYILPDGEGLANKDLEAIIHLIKSHGCKVRIITNGYILNNPSYTDIMKQCDEVIGELMTVTEKDFHKLQRPIESYTLSAHVSNMAAFRESYKGVFDLSITLLKNYSDSDAALEFFKAAVRKINPDHVFVESPDEGKLQQAFGVDETVIEAFKEALNNR